MRLVSFLGIAGIFALLCYYIYQQAEENMVRTRQQAEATAPADATSTQEATTAVSTETNTPAENPDTAAETVATTESVPTTATAEATAAPSEEAMAETTTPAPKALTEIVIQNPWARPSNGETSAAFVTFKHTGKETATLQKITAADIAEKVELHESYEENGVMKMRETPLQLQPGQTFTMERGGNHIMLIGLKKPLAVEDIITLVFTFDTGVITLAVPVMEQAPVTAPAQATDTPASESTVKPVSPSEHEHTPAFNADKKPHTLQEADKDKLKSMMDTPPPSQETPASPSVSP